MSRTPDARRFWDEARTISSDTCMALLDEVQRRAELLMRATGAPESERRRIQEEIMRTAVTRCGGRGSRMSSIPAGRAQEALRIIREWQGDAFDLLEGAT